MADITMCQDESCKQHLKCHRFTARACTIMQSYFVNSPRKDNDCVMFWDNKGYKKEEEPCGK